MSEEKIIHVEINILRAFATIMPTINIAKAVMKRTGDMIATAMRAGMERNTYFTFRLASTAVDVRDNVGEEIESRFMLDKNDKIFFF